MNTYDFDKTIFYPDSSVTFVRWYMRRHPFALLCWLPRMAVIGLAYLLNLIPKEKLKENFIGVDMLTLSATPIPRTLNMAMSGIRDLSTIEQPPIERQPVETFVLEYNDVILAEAMKKELARGGQVYYLHNRVDNIESCAAHVSQMVPGARVGIAHGKMTEEELEGKFVTGVLVNRQREDYYTRYQQIIDRLATGQRS